MATSVALGRNDSPSNWREITSEEADEYRRLRAEAEEADLKASEEKLKNRVAEAAGEGT